MGEAPYFLLLMPVFFGDPAIYFGTLARTANVCCTPDWRIAAIRLREGAMRPQRFQLHGFIFRC
jgi:hypothetical protein